MKNETQVKSSAIGLASGTEAVLPYLEVAHRELERSAYFRRANLQRTAGVAVSPGVGQADSLQRLKNNIEQLEDLHGRLKFMMSEISVLVKKPSF